MTFPPSRLTPAALSFLAERHVATLTTVRADGRLHVVPVGFSWDGSAHLARVITDRASQKARNAAGGCPAVLCQFDGGRWLALAGTARVVDDPVQVAAAEARYAQRYRVPRPNPTRVVIEILIESITGSGGVSPVRCAR